MQTTRTKEMGNLRGKGGAVTGGRSLTNTRQRVVRGIVHEAEEEKETEAAAAGARATGAAAAATAAAAAAAAGAAAGAGAAAAAAAGACPDPGVVVGGGRGARKSLFRVPNANKFVLFLHKCISLLLMAAVYSNYRAVSSDVFTSLESY